MTDTTVKNNETTQKESDESTSKGDIKHIGYAGLIARRFFRQRSAVVGLIILLVLVFLFGKTIMRRRRYGSGRGKRRRPRSYRGRRF